jgi:hypothetical protein
MAAARQGAADFTPETIQWIKARDTYCLACGSRDITIQHRVAKGMGGIGDKHPKLNPADGILLCWRHNESVEGKDQALALRRGWKVPRFSPLRTIDIPVFDAVAGNWYMLFADGGRKWVDPGYAMDRIRMASGAT